MLCRNTMLRFCDIFIFWILNCGITASRIKRGLEQISTITPTVSVVRRLDDNVTLEYSVQFSFTGSPELFQFIWYENGKAIKDEAPGLLSDTVNGTTCFISNSTETIQLEMVTPMTSRKLIFHKHIETPSIVHIPQFLVELQPSMALRFNFGSVTPGRVILPSDDPDGFERELNWSFHAVNYNIEPPEIISYFQWKMRRNKNPPVRYIDTETTNSSTKELYIMTSTDQSLEGILVWSLSLTNINSHSPLDYILIKLSLPVFEHVYNTPFLNTFLGFVNKGQTELTRCPENDACVVVCEVIGFHPSDMNLYKVGENNISLATNFSKILRVQRYHLVAQFAVSKMLKSDEGWYQCEAVNSMDARRQLKFQLFAKQEVKILHNESRLEQIVDTASYGFIITCSAVGHPQPTLTFRENGSRGRIIRNNTDYYIVHHNNDVNVVQRINLTISNLKLGVFAYVCVARNQFDTDTTYFYP